MLDAYSDIQCHGTHFPHSASLVKSQGLANQSLQYPNGRLIIVKGWALAAAAARMLIIKLHPDQEAGTTGLVQLHDGTGIQQCSLHMPQATLD